MLCRLMISLLLCFQVSRARAVFAIFVRAFPRFCLCLQHCIVIGFFTLIEPQLVWKKPSECYRDADCLGPLHTFI